MIMTNLPKKKFRCENCATLWELNQLIELDPTALYDRVAAGEIMPQGSCPECGSFCHLWRDKYAKIRPHLNHVLEVSYYHRRGELVVECTECGETVHSLYDSQRDSWEQEEKQMTHPTIVCLCGSSKFYEKFQEINYLETMAGKIVLSVGFYPHSQEQAHGQEIECTDDQKQALDELHKRKIDLADEVFVLNVGGYIGESTANEIKYAKEQGKTVRWLEPLGIKFLRTSRIKTLHVFVKGELKILRYKNDDRSFSDLRPIFIADIQAAFPDVEKKDIDRAINTFIGREETVLDVLCYNLERSIAEYEDTEPVCEAAKALLDEVRR